MDAGIAGRAMGDDRQRIVIRLRDIHLVKGLQPGYGDCLTSSVIPGADYDPTAVGRTGLAALGCRDHALAAGAGCRPLMKSAARCAWLAAVKIARWSALSTCSNQEQIIM
jgi:hypothetical protein